MLLDTDSRLGMSSSQLTHSRCMCHQCRHLQLLILECKSSLRGIWYTSLILVQRRFPLHMLAVLMSPLYSNSLQDKFDRNLGQYMNTYPQYKSQAQLNLLHT